VRSKLRVNGLESRVAPAANYILTNEHADLQVGYSAGQWSMFVRDRDLNVSYPPETSVQYVNTAFSQNVRPAGSNFDFIGVPEGQPYYRLPQLQNPNLLYHGYAAEFVPAGTFGQYDPAAESHGRESGPGRWVKFQITDFSGPGHFSVWRNADTGPVRYISTFDDGVANPEPDGIDYTDGVGPDDAYWMLEGAHVHLNFAFTAVGRYEITYRPTAIIGGSFQTGPEFTFVYSVENIGQVGFQVAAYSVNESAGNATITLVRTGGADGAVSVDYATGGGTATEGVDYTAAAGTLTFDDLETVKSFSVPIINDALVEPPETVGLTLSNFRPWNKPGGELSDPPIQGTPTTATLTINDDDGAAPPRVSSTAVNNGAAQRSRVTTVAVTFDQPVTFAGLPAAAFQLRRQSDNAAPALAAAVDNSGPGTVVTLTFSGPATESASLADGRYTLTVLASQVPGLDGNGDGTPGDDYVLVGAPANGLFRLFGDADGDGDVDAQDFGAFRAAFGGMNFIFDFDGDGDVDAADFGAFRSRFGTTV
jgi:surface-anchored protein